MVIVCLLEIGVALIPEISELYFLFGIVYNSAFVRYQLHFSQRSRYFPVNPIIRVATTTALTPKRGREDAKYVLFRVVGVMYVASARRNGSCLCLGSPFFAEVKLAGPALLGLSNQDRRTGFTVHSTLFSLLSLKLAE